MEEQILEIKGEPMAKNGSVFVQQMSLNKIKLSRNSRMSISPDELDGLMLSIKSVGLLQPIGVVKNGSGYEVCYGNRRFLACSKLGMTKIPVIVHESKSAHDIDIKNLSENVQRRNINLTEVGRYLELLKKDGLSPKEAAARLGVSATYIETCIRAWAEVPEKYKKDLEVRSPGDKGSAQARGKISIKAVTAIANARRRYGLNVKQTEKLFSAAKSDDRFVPESVSKYAAALSQGKEDPLDEVEEIRYVRMAFSLTTKQHDMLMAKYVDGGPFSSLSGLFRAILRGEKSVKIDVI